MGGSGEGSRVGGEGGRAVGWDGRRREGSRVGWEGGSRVEWEGGSRVEWEGGGRAVGWSGRDGGEGSRGVAQGLRKGSPPGYVEPTGGCDADLPLPAVW